MFVEFRFYLKFEISPSKSPESRQIEMFHECFMLRGDVSNKTEIVQNQNKELSRRISSAFPIKSSEN